MRNGRRRRWTLGLGMIGAAILAASCGGVSSFEDSRLLEFDDQFTTEGQGHLGTGVTFPYETAPPYGGPHDGNLLPCGVYQEEQVPERYVHTMEHGAVIIHYQPDVFTNEDVSALRQLGSELLQRGERVLVVPNRSLSSAVVVASWGRLLPLDSAEETTIRAFVDAFENDGPEDLPRSRAC